MVSESKGTPRSPLTRVRHPELVTHLFSVCTPYTPPTEEYLSNEELTTKYLPQFGYQIQLASGEVEKHINDEQSIRQFLRSTYGARTPSGEVAFEPYKGLNFERLHSVGESKILNGKVSLVLWCVSLLDHTHCHVSSWIPHIEDRPYRCLIEVGSS